MSDDSRVRGALGAPSAQSSSVATPHAGSKFDAKRFRIQEQRSKEPQGWGFSSCFGELPEMRDSARWKEIVKVFGIREALMVV